MPITLVTSLFFVVELLILEDKCLSRRSVVFSLVQQVLVEQRLMHLLPFNVFLVTGRIMKQVKGLFLSTVRVVMFNSHYVDCFNYSEKTGAIDKLR